MSDLPVYDNYEISGCRRFNEDDQEVRQFTEACDDTDAQFWTLYGHINGQGVEAIGDFPSREAAEEVFFRITGEPFTGSCEASPRLRMMHAAPHLLEMLERAEFLMQRVFEGDHLALGNLQSAANDARAAIDVAKEA